jgi:hypothetical protein
MGHYDDDYADQAEQTAIEKRRRLKKILERLNEFKASASYRKEIPERFVHSLEDLENWLVMHTLN